MTKTVELSLSVKEFFLVKEAVEELLADWEHMNEAGDEWTVRLEVVRGIEQKLNAIEQGQINTH